MAANFEKSQSPILDPKGEMLLIGDDGLVRVDGIIAFRVVYRRGEPCIQFCDQDRLRSSCRGTRYVEIPLGVLASKIGNGR